MYIYFKFFLCIYSNRSSNLETYMKKVGNVLRNKYDSIGIIITHD